MIDRGVTTPAPPTPKKKKQDALVGQMLAGKYKILKKIGEEATETVIAAKNGSAKELRSELADLLYHLLVLMVERGLGLDDICRELSGRAGRAACPGSRWQHSSAMRHPGIFR